VLPPVGKTPEPNSIVVELRGLDGTTPSFDLPQDAKLRESQTTRDGGTWIVDLFPGRHRLSITTRGQIPIAGTVPIPAAKVQALGALPGQPRQWVAVAGSDLWAKSPVALRPLSSPPTELPTDAKLRDILTRVASVWRADRTDWSLRVQASPIPAAGSITT